MYYLMTCFLKNLITYLGNLCRLVDIGLSIGLKNYSFPFWHINTISLINLFFCTMPYSWTFRLFPIFFSCKQCCNTCPC